MKNIVSAVPAISALTPLAAGALVCGAGSSCTSPSQKKAPAQERPNVVLIVADDLGTGDLSCYGSTTISTPCIDSLASQGLLFRNAYATSATSSPSRYALFTGMYPWREGLHILPGDAALIIPTDMPTMPKMFQEAGYRTAAIGKWHLGMGDGNTDWNKPIAPSGNTVGFDYTNLIPATVDRVPTVYVENGLVCNLDPDDPITVDYEHELPGEVNAINHPELMAMRWHHGHQGTIVGGIPRIGHMTGGKAALWDDETMAEYFYSKAIAFLDENSSGPFFLYYGLHEPHVPRTASAPFAGVSGLGPRGDVIVEADALVGRVMAYLDEHGLLDNTIVIFTSDNGAVVQDGYIDGSDELLGDHDPNNGLRGGKYSLFDGGTHIPFIVSWKGRIPCKESEALLNQIDLFASFARLLGMEMPEGTDSECHTDVLLGEKTAAGDGRRSQIIEATGRLGYMKDGYALLPPYSGPKTNQTGNELGNLDEYGLFRLTDDPHQDNNLASGEPALLETMKKEFRQKAGSSYNPDKEEEKLQ